MYETKTLYWGSKYRKLFYKKESLGNVYISFVKNLYMCYLLKSQ